MKDLVEVMIRRRSFIGIVCMVALVYFAKPDAGSIFIGFFLVLLGMFFRAWSSGFINKDQELAKNGPYSLTRNPLYFGSFLMGFGFAIAGNTLLTYLIFFTYYLLFFPFLMIVEHRRMKKKFGQEYEEWACSANSFFPKLRRIKHWGFNISYYMRNKEYRVFYYSLVLIAVLILKYLRLIRMD